MAVVEVETEAEAAASCVSRVFGAKCNPLEGIYISAADTDGTGITWLPTPPPSSAALPLLHLCI